MADDLQVFREVYDATTKLRPRASMKRLPFERVEVGDVVLVECTCEREGGTVVREVTFEMLSVAVVAKGSNTPL